MADRDQPSWCIMPMHNDASWCCIMMNHCNSSWWIMSVTMHHDESWWCDLFVWGWWRWPARSLQPAQKSWMTILLRQQHCCTGPWLAGWLAGGRNPALQALRIQSLTYWCQNPSRTIPYDPVRSRTIPYDPVRSGGPIQIELYSKERNPAGRRPVRSRTIPYDPVRSGTQGSGMLDPGPWVQNYLWL